MSLTFSPSLLCISSLNFALASGASTFQKIEDCLSSSSSTTLYASSAVFFVNQLTFSLESFPTFLAANHPAQPTTENIPSEPLLLTDSITLSGISLLVLKLVKALSAILLQVFDIAESADIIAQGSLSSLSSQNINSALTGAPSCSP